MLARIAAFELRQQLRTHVFWVVFALSALMVVGSMSIEQIRIGPARTGLHNSPAAIVQVHLTWSLFYLFTTTALVADAVLRDDLTGFGPILRATPIGRLDYLLGRFAGAFAAAVLCFLSVPLAMMLGALAPWMDAARIGPWQPGAYAYAFFVLAVPNLLVSSAVFFALATTARSMMAAYLGAVALLVAYGLGTGPLGQTGLAPLAALAEPFALGAYALEIQGWSAAERETRLPALDGVLGVNRLLWIGASLALVTAACAAFRFEKRAWRARRVPGQRMDDSANRAGRPAAPATPSVALTTVAPLEFDARTARAQFTARTRLEMRQVFGSPIFAVLILLGLYNAAGASWALIQTEAAQASAPTGALIERLIEAFRLVPVTVVVFYAGELVWAERERHLHEIVAAAPVPDWAVLAPKLLAVVLVVVAMMGAAAATALGAQLAAGSAALDAGAYLWGYVLPQSVDWALVAALAFFFQAVSPNKVAGWGWMVLYLIVSLALTRLGLEDSLYRYGSHPKGAAGQGALAGMELATWYRAYWAALAVVLLVLAQALWGRGVDDRLSARLARLPRRLAGPAGWIVAAAAAAFVVLGMVLGSR